MFYIQETTEMEKTISDLLIKDEKFKKKLNPQSKFVDPLQEINEKLYYKFGWETINKNKFIIVPAKTDNNATVSPVLKKTLSSKLQKKSTVIDDNLFTRATTEGNDNMVSCNDLLNGKSFLKDDEDDMCSLESSVIFYENPFLCLESKSFSRINENNSKFLGKNNINNIGDRPTDYKPKVLTSGKCKFIDFKREKKLFPFN